MQFIVRIVIEHPDGGQDHEPFFVVVESPLEGDMLKAASEVVLRLRSKLQDLGEIVDN